MNKIAIRNYATWARTRLIEQVGQKAFSLGFSREGAQPPEFVGADAIIMNGSVYDAKFKDQREKLRVAIVRKGYDTVMEEAAYTWFNRFAAIRFMEVNGFLEHGIRVLSSTSQGKTDPDVLGKATTVALPTDKTFIFRCIENSRSEDLFRHLILAQCHELNKAMPFLFEPITDYTELLFPANLLQEGSVIRRLVQDIPEENWKDVEIVGWLYQYYISEKQHQVVGISKGVIGKKDLAAATQLFTPHWIVQYMLENSLGRKWLEANPQSLLRSKWCYFLESKNQKISNQNGLHFSPECLTVFDPACGSGHILTYAFDMLYDIYLEAGYLASDIPRLIITKNLFGLDIDDRAAQLAGFALLMKARFRDSGILKQSVTSNIAAIQETDAGTSGLKSWLISSEPKSKGQIEALWTAFRDGKNIGSLISIDHFDNNCWQAIMDSIVRKANTASSDLFEHTTLKELQAFLPIVIKQAQLLSSRYAIVVTNPPYMGRKGLNANLREFVDQYFPDYSSDLFSVFIRRNFSFAANAGYLGFMSPFVWMFIKSFEELRKFIIEEKSITTLVQLEYGAFEDAVVPICTFVLQNQETDLPGVYIKLSDFRGAATQPVKVLAAAKNHAVAYRYEIKTDSFAAIPGSPIAYWASEAVRQAFKDGKPLSDIVDPKKGMDTGNNDLFLRLWHEVSREKLVFPDEWAAIPPQILKQKKWFIYNKGGDYRRWFGNLQYCINWKHNGAAVKAFPNSNLRNERYYFLPGITWGNVSSGTLSFRILPAGCISDSVGCGLFKNESLHALLLGILNSRVSQHIIDMINPTIHYQTGDVGRLPILLERILKKRIEISEYVKDCINLCKTDWDDFEISWDFCYHPLLRSLPSVEKTIQRSFDNWAILSQTRFDKLKKNEKELNIIVLDMYGLTEELTANVRDEEISIHRADLVRDIRSLLSYAVGCMMGRYSLDISGLVFAGGVFDATKYSSFPADDDAIISILDDNWFPDDVTGRFVDFLRVTFGENYLTANLDFIADALGRTASETSMERIRKYFVNDFYKDHLKVYQKRPIYWLFTSGKEKAFQALVYIHRYDKSTLSRMRSEYLHTLQGKLTYEIQQLTDAEQSSTTTREKQAAAKRLTELMKKQEELRKYDELLRHMADQQIEIDLDDGVKVNYAKFNGLVAPI